jgi:putative ABC transport system permease protein
MLRSFAQRRAVDPGFAPAGVVTFRVALPRSRYPEAREVARFHGALLDSIRALPGVRAAGATGRLPLDGPSMMFDPLRVDGVAVPPDQLPPLAEMRVATPGYFEAVGIPLLEGRLPARDDWERRTGAVIVSERIARQVIRGREPVGSRVAHGLAVGRSTRPWSEVVGVVGDVHGVSLQEPPMGAVYYAMQNPDSVDMDWLSWSMAYAVRADVPLAALLPAVRRIVHQADAELPIAEVRPLDAVVDAARAGMRFTVLGLTAAALVGVFLGAVGLYGVLSYLTALRTREIGVRLALGATPRSVRGMVLRHGLLVTVSGLVVGLAGAVALRRLATPLLYGVAPADPPTLVAVAVVLLLVGALATWLPARRAARLDPVRALRAE